MNTNQKTNDFCQKYGITVFQFSGAKEIGGNLDLDGLTAIPDGFNPTVGGNLDLDGLTAIPDGFNPTVGCSLYLRGLTAIPDGFNPTVGGNLDLRGRCVESKNKPTKKINTPNNKLLFWQDGKFVSADGIFTEVLDKKGNLYCVRKIHSQITFFLFTNGETHSHGDTPEKAKEDFRFKILSEKLKNEPIHADTLISVKHFRLITGACEFGTKAWLDQNGITAEKMKASELLPLLEKTNAYGLGMFKQLITF